MIHSKLEGALSIEICLQDLHKVVHDLLLVNALPLLAHVLLRTRSWWLGFPRFSDIEISRDVIQKSFEPPQQSVQPIGLWYCDILWCLSDLEARKLLCPLPPSLISAVSFLDFWALQYSLHLSKYKLYMLQMMSKANAFEIIYKLKMWHILHVQCTIKKNMIKTVCL